MFCSSQRGLILLLSLFFSFLFVNSFRRHAVRPSALHNSNYYFKAMIMLFIVKLHSVVSLARTVDNAGVCHVLCTCREIWLKGYLMSVDREPNSTKQYTCCMRLDMTLVASPRGDAMAEML